MSVFRNSFFTMACLLAGAMLFPHTSYAAESSMHVILDVVDEFGQPIHKIPSIALGGCTVERMGITRAREGGTLFDATVYFTRDQWTQVCSVEVGAGGFVTSSPITLGNLTDGKTVNVQRVQLAHSLVVTARSVEGEVLSDMDAYFNNESYRYKIGDTYYFAPRSKTGTLSFSHPGYVSTNIQGIQLSSEERTAVTLNGVGTCVQTSSNWSCPGVAARLAVDVDNEAGNTFIGGKIEVFTDVKRTQLAPLFTAQPQDAQRTIDRPVVQLPVLPGTYYLKVSKSGYNDYHEKIVVNGSSNSTHIAMGLESANRVSPRQSKVSFSKPQATANGSDTVVINVEARSSDATALNGQEIEIVSSRPLSDTIVYPNGTKTQSSGQLTAYITSESAGESVLTILINGKSISSFKGILFTDETQGGVSRQHSTTASTPSPILADGVESVSVILTVRNIGNETLSNVPVRVESSRSSTDTLSCADTQTNHLGQISCTFRSHAAGTSVLTFYAHDAIVVDEIAVSVSPLTQ